MRHVNAGIWVEITGQIDNGLLWKRLHLWIKENDLPCFCRRVRIDSVAAVLQYEHVQGNVLIESVCPPEKPIYFFIINTNQYLHLHFHIQYHNYDQSGTWQYQHNLFHMPYESVCPPEKLIYSFIINTNQYLPI